jgi:hypothetical protein
LGGPSIADFGMSAAGFSVTPSASTTEIEPLAGL